MANEAKRPTRRIRTHKDGTKSADFEARILSAATQLFGEKGYAGTTMTAIAKAVGIDQSSLYYWFPSKDALLDRILVETNAAGRFGAVEGDLADAPAYLYALAYCDTLNLCLMPVDYFDLESAASKGGARFKGFFESYEQLAHHVHAAIVRGVEAGQLVSVDPWMSALSFLVVNEGVQHRYHQMKNGFDPLRELLEGSLETHMPETYAHLAARDGLSMLVEELGSIDQARKIAEDNGWLSGR
ncbi:MAG: helix-turn-helix domain containing protein [Eggerthellaceae bacterium]|nr:helix-turn-helix domain containing protein [Eggerthellaceae bacterium]